MNKAVICVLIYFCQKLPHFKNCNWLFLRILDCLQQWIYHERMKDISGSEHISLPTCCSSQVLNLLIKLPPGIYHLDIRKHNCLSLRVYINQFKRLCLWSNWGNYQDKRKYTVLRYLFVRLYHTTYIVSESYCNTLRYK